MEANHQPPPPTRERWAPLPAGALVAAGTALDVLAPADLAAAPLLAAAPPLAVALGTFRTAASFRTAAATAGAACLAALGTATERQLLGRPPTWWLAAAVVLAAAASVAAACRRRREGRALESVRNVAEAAQRAVLPVPAERVGPLAVAARYEAAEADARIGGDLYAVQDTPFGVRLIVGDVRGKGMGAVGAVALLLGTFREAADLAPDVADLVRRLDAALEREGARRLRSDRDYLDSVEGFTTAVVGEITPDGGTLRLVNRGHPPPLLVGDDGGVRELAPAEPDVPLGTSGLLPGGVHVETHPLPHGSRLVFFTDGVTEARDAAGRFYDPAVRLSGRTFTGPEHLLDALVADVHRHSGGPTADDLALLAVAPVDTAHPAAPSGAPRTPGAADAAPAARPGADRDREDARPAVQAAAEFPPKASRPGPVRPEARRRARRAENGRTAEPGRGPTARPVSAPPPGRCSAPPGTSPPGRRTGAPDGPVRGATPDPASPRPPARG